MSLSRRHLVSISAASVCAAACARGPRRSSPPPMLDAARLSLQAHALSARARPGLLNIGVAEIGSGRVWFTDRAGQYPLAGLSKLPTAAAVLARVDAGGLRLNQRVRLTPADLSPPPSRVARLFAGSPALERVDLPLADLIALAIQHDDSTAGDAILRLAGGPRAVTQWLRSRGVEGVRIDRYDREWIPQAFGVSPSALQGRDPAAFARATEQTSPEVRQSAMDAYLADPRDTATAPGFVGLQQTLAAGKLVGAESTRFLTAAMQARVGVGLAQGLPAGSVLAEITGTTPTALGFTPADNAAGVASLSDGRRLALVVFIAGSTATESARQRLMADAARMIASGSTTSTTA